MCVCMRVCVREREREREERERGERDRTREREEEEERGERERENYSLDFKQNNNECVLTGDINGIIKQYDSMAVCVCDVRVHFIYFLKQAIQD